MGYLHWGFVFFINKQLIVSVPYKSHQQSVRNAISGEMRTIYTMSPEDISLAQMYITYFKSGLQTAGHN